MATVQGHCDPKFEGLRALLQKSLDKGDECGFSIAVNLDGQDVVNLWGGHADEARTRAWDDKTIVNVWSTTKIVTAIAVLKLVDEGLVSPDDKVSKYWPEFAANGKQDVELRHILSHSSGVAGWDEPLTMEQMCNAQESTPKLAEQPPQWPPGTASAYHAWTYGHLLGEIVRRVSGLSLTEFVATKIAAPVGADFQIGCREEDWPRAADLIAPPTPDLPPAPPGSLTLKMLNPFPDILFANTATWRKGEVGAANGHSNAHALTRILSSVTLPGQPNGLLSEKTVGQIFRQQTHGIDMCTGMKFRYGIGAALRLEGDSILDDWLPAGRVCVWGGWGGSMGIMDLDRKATIVYTMNKMSPEGPVTSLLRAYLKEIYGALKVSI